MAFLRNSAHVGAALWFSLCWVAAAAATTDSKCTPSMCITATLNGTEVEYVMESKTADIGWMGLGFGTMMGNSKMVVMWPNADGSITLSQRTAPYEVMPTVDGSPARVASISTLASSLTGSQPRLAFTIPADGTTKQSLIWAVCSTNPDSAAVDAPLKYHQGHGGLSLTLGTSPDVSSPAPSTPATTTTKAAVPTVTRKAAAGKGSHDHAPVSGAPLAPYQRMIVAHAVFCAAGFLVLLPAGALLARYLRTFTSAWFMGHWIVQFLFSAPVILVGVIMGVKAVNKAGMSHLDDTHKKAGAALVAAYTVQCLFGALIHFVKPKARATPLRRPRRNYAHAALGLLLIALGFAQARNGYRIEWPAVTARSVPDYVNNAWWAWVVAAPGLYVAGLALLPRQHRLERAAAVPRASDEGEDEDGSDDEMALKERRPTTVGYREC